MRRNENGTLVPFDFNTIEQEFPAVRNLNVDISDHLLRQSVNCGNILHVLGPIANAMLLSYGRKM